MATKTKSKMNLKHWSGKSMGSRNQTPRSYRILQQTNYNERRLKSRDGKGEPENKTKKEKLYWLLRRYLDSRHYDGGIYISLTALLAFMAIGTASFIAYGLDYSF